MKSIHLILLCLLSLHSFAKRIAPVAPLTGQYILLKQDVNHKLQVVGGKSKISIDQSRETIKCTLGCNNISGDFSAIGGVIEPLQLISTEKFCSTKLSKLERQFIKNLERVNQYKARSRELYLYHDDELVMVLRRK